MRTKRISTFPTSLSFLDLVEESFLLLLLLLSEQHVFMCNERFHHESLVSDVVERRHGIQLGGPHQCWAEDDAQVLAGHEVLLLVLGHSGWRQDGN